MCTQGPFSPTGKPPSSEGRTWPTAEKKSPELSTVMSVCSLHVEKCNSVSTLYLQLYPKSDAKRWVNPETLPHEFCPFLHTQPLGNEAFCGDGATQNMASCLNDCFKKQKKKKGRVIKNVISRMCLWRFSWVWDHCFHENLSLWVKG